MKSLFKHLKAIDQSQDRTCVTFPRLLTFLLLSSTIFTGTSFLLPISSAQAAPTRRDWCGTVWSVENQNTLAWINPATGLTTTTSGPTSQITMPGGSMGTATAAIGIHKQSGTMYAFDRTGTTGTLYKYQFGVNTAWQAVAISGLIGLSGTQTIAGASNNLNKMSVDGNTLFIAESNGVAVYAIPLNSSGNVVGSATVQTYSFVGDPPGTPPHRSSTSTDLTGTEIINGGDIVTDEYGDVYNITYNAIISYSGSTQILTTTKAYFYKQDPIARTWIYQGQTTGNASFAGAAFYRGDLYVKAGTQLKKVDLTRSGSDYTGWNNALVNVGSPSSTSSADLAACGTPVINLTKTRQIYSDALLTNLVADQTKVATGQYIKYTVTAQNVGDAWARSTQIIDNLPTGTVYLPNSATLNGSNLGLATYPSTFTVNSPSILAGIVRYATDPDTATLSFAVQVTATSGTISNQATSSYVDNEGLPSDPSVCTTTPKVNCANDAPAVSVVAASFSVSGTLYEDTDGGDDLDTSEPKLPAGITVNLLDNSNNVIKTITTDANGAYTFTGVTDGSYKIQVDINDSSIPTDLTLGTPNDLPVTVSGSPVTGKDFGFDKNTIPSPVAPSYCKSTYNEVYAVNQAAGTPDFYAIHGPTGAATKFTSAPSSFGITAINTAATDHVNKMVYYGDANKIYAWDAINDQHITVAANFQSLLTAAGYTGKFVTLSSGGAAFYGGALYVGVDGNRNLGTAPTNFDQDFEIFRVNLSADGKTAVSITPLGIKAKSGGTFTTNTMDDWGDFIISDTGTILALSTNRVSGVPATYQRRFWKFDLNSNTYSFVTNTTENAQLAKSGDGTLWGLRSTSVVKFDDNGNVIGSPVTTTVQAFDGAECVVGNASVGDRVWNDTNGDGIQDAGEVGIAGVTVAIYRDINKNGVIDASEPKLATQVTDANGNYDFTGLLPHDRLTGTGHNDFIVKVESGVPTGATNTTPTVKAADLSSATEDFNNADFGYRLPAAGNPNILLVKRITRVNNNTITKNGDNLAGYIDEATNSYDDNILDNPAPVGKADTNKWVDADNNAEPDLIGGINGGNVRPGDEIEYTIYYLSAGDTTANNVLICDRVPENATFMPTAFNSFPTKNTSSLPSGDRGIIWQNNGVIESLTNFRDGDTAEYLSPGIDPTINYPGIKCDGSNTNGVVVVKLGNIPNATAPGTPTNSYGFIRFRGRVK